jgi:hypothetical protein
MSPPARLRLLDWERAVSQPGEWRPADGLLDAAQAMAMLRNLAIGLIRLAGLDQIKRTLERIAADRMRMCPFTGWRP